MMFTPTSTLMPRALSIDAQRWRDVTARTAQADGRFVYGVTSTGIYCRPSCPSRRPRPDRVRYFSSSTDAERAGYRACLRCRPDGARPVSATTRAVVNAASFLRRHVSDPVTLADLALRVGLSAAHLQRAFTAHTGVSPREFQAACRAERFRQELRSGHDVTTATYEAGYGSPSRVSHHRPTGRGLAPAEFRRGAPGHEVTFAVVPSALGRLLVAGTAKGVCAVKLGDSDEALVEDLRRDFPKADLRAGSAPASWAAAIARAVRVRPALTPDVPLDVQGTAFQWQVWKALQAIPPGETRTYAAVAAAIGRPRAVRAVARACASNPVALAVPCHRVVPAAGGTGGYRWGARRKAALLERERRAG